MAEEKVCIIGAGSTGLVSVKVLQEAGIPFDCFEMASDIGGNWRYNNDNGRSAAYDTLHIDTSKTRMAFSDFPMSDEYPPFAHHSQVLDYFEQYSVHFGLKERITFRTKVVDVAPAGLPPNSHYQVTTQNLDTGEIKMATYRAVLVCNGHHWNPKMPTFQGHFSGECFHSQQYRNFSGLEGKNVLVIGVGNSGTDIASDISRVTKQTYLSSRRGFHVIPRFIFGRPVDTWVTPAGTRLPLAIQRFFYRLLIFLTLGNQENYGVPRSPNKLLEEHPTVAEDLLKKVSFGDVIMKPDVAELRGDKVAFVDGSEAQIDTIICATGYQISFPFFQPSFIEVQDNHLPLYRHVVHPDYPGLYFIGLVQPLGAIMPLAEVQAEWVAGLLSGRVALPNKATMHKTIAKTQADLRKRYVKSTRHTIQVDFFPYKRELEAEMKQGRRQVG